MKTLYVLIVLLVLAGCQSITGSNFYTYNVTVTADQGSTVGGATSVAPENKSTNGVVTSTQTIPSNTPISVTLPVIP